MSIENFIDRLYSKEIKDRIVVTPLISNDQIGNGIIDLRLGTEFILTKKSRFSELDISKDKLEKNIKTYQDKITLNIKDKIILHPNQFILGCTLEFIKVPNDIMGYIIGRSSWGRLGLIIATATLIKYFLALFEMLQFELRIQQRIK